MLLAYGLAQVGLMKISMRTQYPHTLSESNVCQGITRLKWLCHPSGSWVIMFSDRSPRKNYWLQWAMQFLIDKNKDKMQKFCRAGRNLEWKGGMWTSSNHHMCRMELIGNRTRGTKLAQTQHEHQAEDNSRRCATWLWESWVGPASLSSSEVGKGEKVVLCGYGFLWKPVLAFCF